MNTHRITSWIFGAAFVFAGLTKVPDPASFAASIRGFRLVGDPLPAILAVSLPWLEVFCGVFIVIGICRLGALITLNTCLATFIIAITSALVRGIDIQCGCFGNALKLGTATELALDAALLAAGLYLLRRETGIKHRV